MTSELFQHINYAKAYRKNRLAAAEWVLEYPETFEELLQFCFHEDEKLATKATWAFEFICRRQLPMIYPHLDELISNLHKVRGDGALRSMAFMCELITLGYYKKNDEILRENFTAKHKEIMTEHCFDWMISNQKVACQARAMTALYLLGTEIDWIHPELQTILEQNIHQGSAGYKSRGGSILRQIKGLGRVTGDR